MEKAFNYVYITTNAINGKQYVGDHATDNIDDSYIGSGRYFGRSIKKYGKENFKKDILEFFDTKESAYLAQEKYIQEFDTMSPKGYNLSPTGGCGNGGNHSLESKEKISKANKGKVRSPETKLKCSLAKQGVKLSDEHKSAIGKGGKGRIFSEEHKLALHNAKLGSLNPHFEKPVSIERKEKLSKAAKAVAHVKCPHCGNEFTPWGIIHHQKKLNKNGALRKE